ncbi:MAG: hypothetical protein J6334_04670, partial [Kiritimatiellae bacterium]|nr:hypothetical protein [Kiritimatiellia bacterium]
MLGKQTTLAGSVALLAIALAEAGPITGWTKRDDGLWETRIPSSTFSEINPFTDFLLTADGGVGGPAARLLQDGRELALSGEPLGEVRTRPGECLMNLAGITSAGKTVPGVAAVERKGLGDGYQTPWGVEIGHLREGASCVYRGFDLATPEARRLAFHVSSGMQDACLDLFDAAAPDTRLGTLFSPYTGDWKKYVTVTLT